MFMASYFIVFNNIFKLSLNWACWKKHFSLSISGILNLYTLLKYFHLGLRLNIIASSHMNYFYNSRPIKSQTCIFFKKIWDEWESKKSFHVGTNHCPFTLHKKTATMVHSARSCVNCSQWLWRAVVDTWEKRACHDSYSSLDVSECV